MCRIVWDDWPSKIRWFENFMIDQNKLRMVNYAAKPANLGENRGGSKSGLSANVEYASEAEISQYNIVVIQHAKQGPTVANEH